MNSISKAEHRGFRLYNIAIFITKNDRVAAKLISYEDPSDGHLMIRGAQTKFNGFYKLNGDYTTNGKKFSDCSNCCEIVQIALNNDPVVCWVVKCRKWVGRQDRVYYRKAPSKYSKRRF